MYADVKSIAENAGSRPNLTDFLTYQILREENLSGLDAAGAEDLRTQQPRFTGPHTLVQEWLAAAARIEEEKNETAELGDRARDDPDSHSGGSDASETEGSGCSDLSRRSATSEGSVITDLREKIHF